MSDVPYLYLSIDPAASKPHTGAYWSRGKLMDIKRARWQTVLQWPIPDEMIIEDQFVAKINPANILKVSQSAGHLVGALGWGLREVQWALPRVWMQGAYGCSTRMNKKGGERDIRQYKVHKFNLELLDPNERIVYRQIIKETKNKCARTDIADAVGLGLFGLGRSLVPSEIVESEVQS